MLVGWVIMTVILTAFSAVGWVFVVGWVQKFAKPEVYERWAPFVRDYRTMIQTGLMTALLIEGAWWLWQHSTAQINSDARTEVRDENSAVR